jgi:hypothetical protein
MATKIKDGVFVGDAEAAQDVDFLEANKVGVSLSGWEVN